ncbi:hypothetical protein INR49_020288 [Caranx melampygus]|nr:hypothetical protein INR49_020288 [Caranx melampygus]
MSPLVEESWEWTSVVSLSSGSIFFANCHWPPTPSWPPLWSSPSSELQSGQGS